MVTQITMRGYYKYKFMIFDYSAESITDKSILRHIKRK